MAQKKGKRALVTTISVLAVLLIAIGTVALVRALNPDKKDPYLQQDTSSTSDADANTNTPQEPSGQNSDTDDTTSAQTDTQPSLDPATVSTIDIVPMSITVSYVKGTGGFEYEVLRANNGTRYAEFRSETLVGSKCTNDTGTFASIIASPTESESTTLAKTTTVDGTVYGLSLTDTTCTSDAEQLQQYQKSFSDAFHLLKKAD